MPNLICPAIIVPDSTSDDSRQIEQSVCDFVFWAEDAIFLLPSEYPHEARLAFYLLRVFLDDWLNGHLSQVAFNSRNSPEVWLLTQEAFSRVSCPDCADIWREFAEVTARWVREHGETIWNSSDIDDPPEWSVLDERLSGADCPSRLFDVTAAWLKGLPVWRPLPPAQFAAERNAVVARNPHFAERQAARFGAGQTRLLDAVGEQLCKKAGLLFFSANPHFAVSMPVDATVWSLTTDQGPRTMHLRDGTAELFLPDTEERIAAVTWTSPGAPQSRP